MQGLPSSSLINPGPVQGTLLLASTIIAVILFYPILHGMEHSPVTFCTQVRGNHNLRGLHNTSGWGHSSGNGTHPVKKRFH